MKKPHACCVWLGVMRRPLPLCGDQPPLILRWRVFMPSKAAEKALKAMMCLHGLEYRRTHDLEELADKLEAASVTPPITQDQLSRLTPYAVEFRYDDEALQLMSGVEAEQLVATLLTWAEAEIHQETGAPPLPSVGAGGTLS